MLAKTQLHFHTNQDPKDTFIQHSPYDAIDKAAEEGYHFLSFTHHVKYVFDKEWQRYALNKGIVLIPGVEFEIKRKHIIAFNADENINKVKTFRDLYEYKQQKKNVFILAPHPFYPGTNCLKEYMHYYHFLFDSVEYSLLYTKNLGHKPNLLANNFSKNYKKPIIGTSDVHKLDSMSHTYSYVNVDFDLYNLDKQFINYYIKNLFDNIRKNNIQTISQPMEAKEMLSHNIFFLKGWAGKPFKKKYLNMSQIGNKTYGAARSLFKLGNTVKKH